MDAVDDECGIGFRSSGISPPGLAPFLSGLALGDDEEPKETWSRRERFLLPCLVETLRCGRSELELTDAMVAELSDPDITLPDAFHVCVTLEGDDEPLRTEAVTIHAHHTCGPSGAMFFGRFCNGSDIIRTRVAEHLLEESASRPCAIFAEIAHLSHPRQGNVLNRPLLRDWEIPVVTSSPLPSDRQISIADLLVSVVGDRILLHSRTLGCEVIPRLTTAHQASDEVNLPLYAFLSALQFQAGGPMVSWRWGALEGLPTLPRVRYGRVVLAPARWCLTDAERDAMAQGSDASRWRNVQRMRQARAVPRFVALEEGSTRLPLDLDNPLCLEVLARVSRQARVVRFEELAGRPDKLCVRGAEGRYAHELVVPFVRRHEQAIRDPGPKRELRPTRGRAFLPGSEWLYAKLYVGPATADRLLRGPIADLARKAVGDGWIDRWFFLRYADPQYHIRIRLHGKPDELLQKVLPGLHELVSPLSNDGTVERLELGTFSPEVERYGGYEALGLVEQLFHADSESALDILRLMATGEALADHWLAVSLSVERLLALFTRDYQERRHLLMSLRSGFADSVGGLKPSLIRQLASKYRKERDRFERCLMSEGMSELWRERCGAALAHRAARIEPVIRDLRDLSSRGQLTRPLHSITEACLHLCANRLLREAANQQEVVLYDFLSRWDSSRMARAHAVGDGH
jgi:thiopeptide-type bacteriocin biosynthesis protein